MSFWQRLFGPVEPPRPKQKFTLDVSKGKNGRWYVKLFDVETQDLHLICTKSFKSKDEALAYAQKYNLVF